jgi:purine-binding chemotaxis protein CheW
MARASSQAPPQQRASTKGIQQDEALRLATFAVGSDLFAIDIMRIREIARPLPITAVPRAPHGMVGVIDLRGQVLPLFDLRERFELPPREAAEEATVRHLMIKLDGRTFGVVVDAMHDVVGVTRGQLRVGPGVLIGEAAEVFYGVCPIAAGNGAPDRLALLLNLRRLITRHDRLALNEILRPGRAP